MDNFRQYIYDKCVGFAIRMVKLTRYLQQEKHEYVVSKQICKSGTSIGANLAEAQYGASRKDFLAKYYISLREASETCYWLEVLLKAELITDKQYQSLNNDCVELKKIFNSITNKTKSTINNDGAKKKGGQDNS